MLPLLPAVRHRHHHHHHHHHHDGTYVTVSDGHVRKSREKITLALASEGSFWALATNVRCKDPCGLHMGHFV